MKFDLTDGCITQREYRDALEALRVDHREAAKLLGCSPRTSRRYAAGTRKISGPASKLLKFHLSQSSTVGPVAPPPSEPIESIRHDIEQKLKSTGYENSLEHLADQICEKHQQVRTATRSGVERGIEAGTLLIEAKDKVKHGEWSRWLRDSCDISERTARLYMQLARSRETLEDLANLTIEGAAKLLAKPKSEPSFNSGPEAKRQRLAVLKVDAATETTMVKPPNIALPDDVPRLEASESVPDTLQDSPASEQVDRKPAAFDNIARQLDYFVEITKAMTPNEFLSTRGSYTPVRLNAIVNDAEFAVVWLTKFIMLARVPEHAELFEQDVRSLRAQDEARVRAAAVRPRSNG